MWFLYASLKPSSSPRTVLLLALIGASSYSWGEASFTGGLSLGFEYDTNVAVDEVDKSSNLSDIGRVFGAEIEAQFDVGEQVSGRAFYDYQATNYAEFDSLNRQTHSAGASLSTDLSKWKAGVSYFFTNSQLNNTNFLTYHRFSPSISGFTSKRWFFRSAYVYGDKSLEKRPGRDATAHGLETDAYYFWRGLRRYFNVGYAYRDENSRADRFSYSGHLIKLRAVQRFDTNVGRRSTLELGFRYEERNYDSITPSINNIRADGRLRIIAKFDYPLNELLSWQIYADYSDYNSNLPSADYEQIIIGTSLSLSF